MAMYEIGFRIGSTVGGALSGIKNVGSALSDLQERSKKINESIGKFGAKQSLYGGKLFKETAVVTAGIASLVYPAMQFERELVNVRKAMKGIDDIEFNGFKNELLSLGDQVPLSLSEITKISSEIAQSGVQGSENILSLTNTVGKLGTALGISGEQASGMASQIMDAYKTPVTEMSGMFDLINDLSNGSTKKAQDITSVMSGIGTGAKGFGLSDKEAAMFSTMGLSGGQGSGKATAAFNSFFTKMNNKDGQGKEFHSMLKDLGLSADAIRAGQKEDAASALIDVFAQIANFDEKTQAAAMSTLFGDGGGGDVLKDLLKGIPELRSQLKQLRDVDEAGNPKYLGSLDKDLGMVQETASAQFQILKNQMVQLSVVVGESLLPTIKSLFESVSPVITQFADWAKANPELIQQGIKVAGVVIGMRLGFLALNYTIFGMIKNILQITAGAQKAWGVLKIGASVVGKLGVILRGALLGGIKLVGNAVLWLGRALMMNPIGAAITGIAVAAFLIYKYWEPIKGFFQDLWMNLKAFFSSGIGNISKTILNWSPIGLFYKVFAAVMNWFGVELPADFTSFGGAIIDGLIGGVKTIWAVGQTIFTNIVDFIKNPFGLLSPEMQALGGDIIEGLVGGAKNTWEGTKAFFTGVIEFIQNPFGTLKDAFTGYGGDIIDGVVGGINSKLTAAKETIVNVGNSIKGWFTSVLGIKSPSRVFMGFGENITEGAAIGIENGLPKAKTAVDKLSNEMQLTSSLLGGESGSGGYGGGRSRENSSQGGITIHFSPTITAGDVTGVKEALNISKQELERMINDLMRQQQRRSFT